MGSLVEQGVGVARVHTGLAFQWHRCPLQARKNQDHGCGALLKCQGTRRPLLLYRRTIVVADDRDLLHNLWRCAPYGGGLKITTVARAVVAPNERPWLRPKQVR